MLSLLYFAQARDVRRLRENAEFLVEGDPMPTHPESMRRDDAPAAAAAAAKEPKEAARAAAASAPTDAEAFRRAELARQAAERRQRFERPPHQRGRPGGPASALPSTAVIIIGALILLAGHRLRAPPSCSAATTRPPAAPAAARAPTACPPGQTKVAVLNGTAETGLAAGFAR